VEQVKDVAVPSTPKSSMPTFVVPENETHKGKKSFLISCLAVGVVVLILVSYAAGYYHWFVAENTVLAKPQSFVIKSTPAKKVYPVRPAFKKELSDSSKTAAVKSEKSQEPSAKELSKQYEQLPGGKYLIIGTLEEHEMKATDTLIKLSKKIYGSKDYVKYIIFYNHLENPDLIALGTKLKMPKLAHEE
jgi:nucleoid-associated protein YgaU